MNNVLERNKLPKRAPLQKSINCILTTVAKPLWKQYILQDLLLRIHMHLIEYKNKKNDVFEREEKEKGKEKEREPPAAGNKLASSE